MNRLFAWLSGQLTVQFSTFLVLGSPQVDEPIKFSIYGCLYPDEPQYRAYTYGNPSTDIDKLSEVRQEIAAIQLPADAEERYQQQKQARIPLVSPAITWLVAEGEARRHGLPIGGYAVGHADGERRGMLWMMNIVSPTTFIERLKHAARS
jgi:hypothetical protein